MFAILAGTLALHAEARGRLDGRLGGFFVAVRERPAALPGRAGFSAWVEVQVPPGRTVERVEIYVDQDLRSTFHQPPFALALPDVPSGPFAITAVAYLDNGDRAEDVLLANAAVPPEKVDVHDVELWVGAFDRRNRAADDLEAADFTVLENGVPQTIERFRMASELPLNVGILLDVSPTMEHDGALDEALARADAFLEDVLRPGDHAGLFTFREQPTAVVPFVSDLAALRAGLATVEVDRTWVGTAIFDSVVEILPRFGSLVGRRALLVITDGLDNHSRYRLADVIPRARRANVRVYAMLVGRRALGPDLADLARETGGMSHRVRHPVDLSRIYRQIGNELRSQYMVGYRSSWAGRDEGCRRVEVAVERDARALEARTMRGYCP